MNDSWQILFSSLWDDGADRTLHLIPGVDLYDWMSILNWDWDDVDRIYIDHESIGA